MNETHLRKVIMDVERVADLRFHVLEVADLPFVFLIQETDCGSAI